MRRLPLRFDLNERYLRPSRGGNPPPPLTTHPLPSRYPPPSSIALAQRMSFAPGTFDGFLLAVYRIPRSRFPFLILLRGDCRRNPFDACTAAVDLFASSAAEFKVVTDDGVETKRAECHQPRDHVVLIFGTFCSSTVHRVCKWRGATPDRFSSLREECS